MWLNEEYSNFFEQGVLASEKIDEKDDVEVYSSQNLGNILSIDGKLSFCKKDASPLFEMLVHVPLCTHPNVSKVLILNGASGGAAREVLRHEDIKIDVVDEKEALKELCAKHFTDLHAAFSDERVSYTKSNVLSFLEKASDDEYDVVIVQAGVKLDDILLAQLNRVLKNDAILVTISKNWWIDSEGLSKELEKLSQKFNIVMPYKFEGYSHAGFAGSMIFSSNKYHPTASMILQKADLLDDLEYYSCDVHVASFTLPVRMRKELYPVMKV